MFKPEQFPIHRQFHTASPTDPANEISERLRGGVAVYMPAGDRAYLFTAEDEPLFGETGRPAAKWLERYESLRSPVVASEDVAAGRFETLERLLAGASRPVVFREADGTIAGYCRIGELLAYFLRERRRFASYFQTLAETVSDAVTVVDRTGTVICWNGVAEETYGIGRDTIVGRRIGEHFQPDALVVLRMLDEGRTVRNTYHRPRPGNHVLINASPVLDEDGRIIGGIATEQDITQLVRLNDELMSAHAAFPDDRPGADEPFPFIKGKSRRLETAVRLARKAAGTENPLLLVGEPGVGKQQLARMIHQLSPRAKQPFLTVHCASIPDGLLETELFGYQGGTFTGNGAGGPGKLELADEGTLFLNGIDRLPPDVQAKLYEYVQRQTVYRVGGTEPIPVRARIIAATERNLGELVRERSFRSDLYYALNVISIVLPALRERKEDLPSLVQTFARQFALQYQKPVPQFDPEVLLAFANYDWPGNLNELTSVVERCLILSEDERIGLSVLPAHLQKEQPKLERSESEAGQPQFKALRTRATEQEEKALIEEALAQTLGNKSAAAKLLGISRGTLYNKMRELRLEG
ncbi:sigma-54 interaction domain-containing protein [Cohnella massiliensis]|uniref:sigma-54 interaction domain-containing protein n=1 Tax=Cohnella massiliensis TaxID=1816691 RepID=UPI0009B9AD70|nr:sigma 54-interacting transcriptional regulator [Cohnella massiliensis]